MNRTLHILLLLSLPFASEAAGPAATNLPAGWGAVVTLEATRAEAWRAEQEAAPAEVWPAAREAAQEAQAEAWPVAPAAEWRAPMAARTQASMAARCVPAATAAVTQAPV